MKKKIGVVLLSIFPLTAFTKFEDIIEWNEGKLSFEDFKIPYKSTVNRVEGEFKSQIKWSFNITSDRIPKYKIYNHMNTNASWISVEHEGLLNEYQLMWDIQELYVRKMRKVSNKLTEEKEKDLEIFRKNFKILFSQLQKERNKYNGVIVDQPDFYNILNKQYQDSLKIYDNYKLN